ncbi:Ig-like domain-containing protein, partial [Fictibacillus sp. 26RED30]|uniref:Ig-like domain-containing protein n=1 Tax=Fictibacillus sp. 26RED30 TaxID=2745877 RepID=UPI0018CD28A1|nr:Ig-like domain-containing protein [Fictibacillus sp. 26RED30]
MNVVKRNTSKLMLNFLILILTLMPAIVSANEVVIKDPTPDITPPSLSSLHLKEITVGKSYKLSAEISDDLSGVDYVAAYYKSPSGLYSKNLSLSYNSTTKKYETTFTFTEYDESGEWILDQIYLRDIKNNAISLYNITSSYPEEIKRDFSPYSINVLEGLEDTVPPTLNNVDIMPEEEVTNGGIVTISADVTDVGAGVEYVNVSLLKPSRATKNVFLYYNSVVGKYVGSFSIDQYDELGEWKLSSVAMKDKARNYKTIYDSILYPAATNKMDFSSMNFDVVKTTPDLLGPVLDTLAISLEQTDNNNALIKLSANISDNLSGLNSLSANYTKPSGKSYFVSFRNNYNTGKYEASIPIDKYDELGTWKLRSISIRDNKDNSINVFDNLENYYNKDTKDFSPFHFTVRGIITVPPATPFSISPSEKSLILERGDILQLKATLHMSDGANSDITSGDLGTVYISSNPSALTVSKDGLITISDSANPGTVYVQISNGGLHTQVQVKISGGSQESYLQISPIDTYLSAGQTTQITSIAFLADGTTKDVTNGSISGIEYTSSNESIATVTKNGVVQILPDVKLASVIIRVKYQDIIREAKVNVTGAPDIKSLLMTPSNAEINAGETIQLSVRATMSDGTSKDATDGETGTKYFSSDITKAVVDENGLISIPEDAKSGTVTITATNNNITIKSSIIVYEGPQINEIILNTGSIITLLPGDTYPLSVTAKLTDGTTKYITEGSTGTIYSSS